MTLIVVSKKIRSERFSKMAKDYSNGYNLNNIKNILNYKGELKRENLDDNLAKIFDFFDKNKNGTLNTEELNEIYNQVIKYGATGNKSIFEANEVSSFTANYKNKNNKTLKQIGVTTDGLYQFFDTISKQTSQEKQSSQKIKTKKIISMNYSVENAKTYKELATWLYKQEGKVPTAAEIDKRTKELVELNKNSSPKIKDGNLKGNLVRIKVDEAGSRNISKNVATKASNAIKGVNWNSSGIKKIQKMFDNGEIHRYNVVVFLDAYNHTKGKDGNITSKTQLGDSSFIDAIISETEFGSNSNKIKLLTSLITTVYQAAIDAGVPENTAKQLTKDFKTEMNKQLKFFEGTGMASADAQGMENILNSMVGQIKAAKSGVKATNSTAVAERFASDNSTTVSGNVSNKVAISTAQEFYKIVDENSDSVTMSKLKTLLSDPKKFNPDNAVEMITAYNSMGIKHGDSDIIDSILSDKHFYSSGYSATIDEKNKTWLGKGPAYDVIYKITNTLKKSAKNAGAPDRFINEARQEWLNEMYKLKVSGISKLEENEIHMRYINKLMDLAGTKSVGAVGDYANGRGSDSWVGVGADYVFGLFGCKTMAEMEVKLGKEAKSAKELVSIANKLKTAKTETQQNQIMKEFSAKYKAIFGVEYNSQVMEAREKMQDRVASIQINKQLQPVFTQALKGTNFAEMRSALDKCKVVMGTSEDGKKIYLSELVSEQVEMYLLGAKTAGVELSKEDAYKFVLNQMKEQYAKVAKDALGNSNFDQMQVDLEQLNQAAYGTSNIGKEVAKFNQNQALTQQYSELALDVAATIATCWIPGLGEAAGLKMVETFGRLANGTTKLAKFYKTLELAGKGLYKASKFAKALQTGTAIGKIERVGETTVRTIQVGSKTIQLGKVANLALTTAISGVYNSITSGATVTGMHALEHMFKNQNWDNNFAAGKGMAIFGGVSAVTNFAGQVVAGIVSKLGCSSALVKNALAFVVEQAGNFGYANYETVAAYVAQRQKEDPSYSFSKMTPEELWEVIASDENLINNTIMLTMTIVTHLSKSASERRQESKLRESQKIKLKGNDYNDYVKETFAKDPKKYSTVIKRCQEIHDQFGVEIHFEETPTGEVGATLNEIYKELSSFKMLGGNDVNKPTAIRLNSDGSIYFNMADGSINMGVAKNGLKSSEVRRSLRHELLHCNDQKPNLGDKFPSSFNKTNIEAYTKELLDAGLTLSEVKYAFSNRREFISAASQADASKFSPAMKKLLVDCGMPEYVLKMNPADVTVTKPRYTPDQLQKITKFVVDYVNKQGGVGFRKSGTKLHNEGLSEVVKGQLEELGVLDKLIEEDIREINEYSEKNYGFTIEELIECRSELPDEFNEISGLIKNATASKEIAFAIQENEFFTPYKLSLVEIYQLKDAIRSNNFNAIDEILSKNNPELFNSLGSIHPHEKVLKPLKERIEVIESTLKESVLPTVDCGIKINGEPLRIATTEKIIPKNSPKTNINFAELVESNMLTTDCIEVLLENNISIPEKYKSTSAKNVYKNPFNIDIDTTIQKVRTRGISSLTSYEVHALTDMFSNLYKDPKFKVSFADKLEAKTVAKATTIYQYVNALKEPAQRVLSKYKLDIRDHCVMRVLDRNLYNPIDNTTQGKIYSYQEFMNEIGSRASQWIKDNPTKTFGSINIENMSGSGVTVLIKYEGNKWYIDTVISK